VNLRGAVRQHGAAFVQIGFVSLLGIVATAGFQLVAVNGLGPAKFGLLASFLALINVVSVGSSALRNSVAVMAANSSVERAGARPRWDASLIEGVVLGVACALVIVVASPWLETSLATDFGAIMFTAAAALPYFLFARAQGLLQGVGRSRSVVWWSTGAQLAQFLLAAVVVFLGGGPVGVVIVLLIVAVGGTVGASVQARGISPGLYRRAFSADSSVVLALTVLFAWLINADVILVRAGVAPQVAGGYAAAEVVVKTLLIVPATLSLYLLPRFVGRRQDISMTRLGVNVTLVVTLVSGAVMFVGVLLFGNWAIGILFPGSYDTAASLLPGLALMWIPWAAAQGVLIRVTASASRSGVVVFVLAIPAQWILGRLILPDVGRFIAADGILGILVLAGMLVIHLRASAALRPTVAGSSEPPVSP